MTKVYSTEEAKSPTIILQPLEESKSDATAHSDTTTTSGV
jgi:hypothetical protein